MATESTKDPRNVPGKQGSAVKGNEMAPGSMGASYERPKEESDPYVRTLPMEAKTALAKAGIKDIAFIAAVDHHGAIRLLVPENGRLDLVNFDQDEPLLNEGLTGLNSISMLSYKGSHCYIWSDGTEVDAHGNVILLGTGGTQGRRVQARICLMR